MQMKGVCVPADFLLSTPCGPQLPSPLLFLLLLPFPLPLPRACLSSVLLCPSSSRGPRDDASRAAEIVSGRGGYVTRTRDRHSNARISSNKRLCTSLLFGNLREADICITRTLDIWLCERTHKYFVNTLNNYAYTHVHIHVGRCLFSSRSRENHDGLQRAGKERRISLRARDESLSEFPNGSRE